MNYVKHKGGVYFNKQVLSKNLNNIDDAIEQIEIALKAEFQKGQKIKLIWGNGTTHGTINWASYHHGRPEVGVRLHTGKCHTFGLYDVLEVEGSVDCSV